MEVRRIFLHYRRKSKRKKNKSKSQKSRYGEGGGRYIYIYIYGKQNFGIHLVHPKVLHACFPNDCAERLLKANLVQPLTDSDSLNSRLDAIDELLASQTLFDGLRSALGSLPRNIGELLGTFGLKRKKGYQQMSQRLEALIQLKRGLDILPSIPTVLEETQAGRSSIIFSNIQEQLSGSEALSALRVALQKHLDDEIGSHRVGFQQTMQQA